MSTFDRDSPRSLDDNREQMELFAELERPLGIEVSGFSLRVGYIGDSEERELLQRVDCEPWETAWRRRIQQYGAGYSGKIGGKPAWVRDFPDWLRTLAARVEKDAGFERFPENCVINEYVPPLGIAPHRDYPAFGPRIACVSLGSDIVMDFIRPPGDKRVGVHVPARSLWILSGQARSLWQHGIAARLTDVIQGERRARSRRVSITFRTMKEPVGRSPESL